MSTVIITGLDRAIGSLEGIVNIEKSTKPILDELAIDTVKFAPNRIELMRDPSNMPFRPLKPSTIEARARGRLLPGPKRGKKARHGKGQKPPYPILKWTGKIIRSIFARSVPLGMEFGTTVPYSIYHQYGTSKMVRRAFFPLDMRSKPEKNNPGGEFWDKFINRCKELVR